LPSSLDLESPLVVGPRILFPAIEANEDPESSELAKEDT